jgi:hypothetical protein
VIEGVGKAFTVIVLLAEVPVQPLESVTITLNEPAEVTGTGNTNLCSGQTATLKSNTGSGFTYFWKKNGSAIAGASTSTYIVSGAGDYTCTVTNTNGCTKISNTVTITNNCKDEEGAFSNENTPVKWLIYPNPASEKLHVKLWLPGTENGNCELELRNILGEVIYTEKLIYEMNYLSVELHLDRSLAAGLYFVIVKQGEGLYRTPFMISRH